MAVLILGALTVIPGCDRGLPKGGVREKPSILTGPGARFQVSALLSLQAGKFCAREERQCRPPAMKASWLSLRPKPLPEKVKSTQLRL